MFCVCSSLSFLLSLRHVTLVSLPSFFISFSAHSRLLFIAQGILVSSHHSSRLYIDHTEACSRLTLLTLFSYRWNSSLVSPLVSALFCSLEAGSLLILVSLQFFSTQGSLSLGSLISALFFNTWKSFSRLIRLSSIFFNPRKSYPCLTRLSFTYQHKEISVLAHFHLNLLTSVSAQSHNNLTLLSLLLSQSELTLLSHVSFLPHFCLSFVAL